MVTTKDAYMQELAKKALEVLKILESKGTGYNPTETEGDYDPFYNYTLGAELAGITPEQAMMSRIGEKLIRLSNILKDQSKQGTEAITETAQDIVGISLMLWQLCDELHGTSQNTLEMIEDKNPGDGGGSIFQRLLGVK